MTKLIVVVGATGGQGGSVVKTLLKNPEWRLRGITRNPSGAAAERLASQGVEVVAADLDDPASLDTAFAGASAIYAVTNYPGLLSQGLSIEDAMHTETKQGLNMARAASKVPELEQYIWSTLPDSEAISGKQFFIPHFCGKARVDVYIRKELPDLFSKTTLVTLGLYGDNFQYPVTTPRPFKSTGKYIHIAPWPPETPVSLVGSHKDNVGPVVQAILQQGASKIGSRHVVVAVEETTAEGMLKMWSEVTGKEAVHVQISMKDYDTLWPKWGVEMAAMYMWWQHEKKCWWAHPDEDIITIEQLGLKPSDLVSTKQAMLTQDWDALC